MKTVLVTGSEGFIGHHICNLLLEKGYRVIGVDNLSKYGDIYRLHRLDQNFRLLRYDLTEDDEFFNLEGELRHETIDYIIHAAARIGGIEYFHEIPFDLIRDNSMMDANMVDMAVRYSWGGKMKRFVAISSSMVFENTNEIPSPENCIGRIPPPSSAYGFAKLALEYKVRAAHDQEKLEYVICRPFNASGIGEEDFIEGKKSHVIPDLIVKCLKNDGTLPLAILGSGSQVRCYTAVQDIARGIVMAMESKEAANQDFNISIPVATTVVELAQKIWEKIHPDKPFSYVSETPFKYDVQRRIPDVTKAANILGFTASIDLDTSLNQVIQHIRKNLK